ncbi:MAG: hypothetical protein RR382_00150 [Tannerellaceae bacterium]
MTKKITGEELVRVVSNFIKIADEEQYIAEINDVAFYFAIVNKKAVIIWAASDGVIEVRSIISESEESAVFYVELNPPSVYSCPLTVKVSKPAKEFNMFTLAETTEPTLPGLSDE